jgi:tyrosine-protein kinase Etk/Wzc
MSGSDEIVFCLSDIWKIFLRYKKAIFISSFSLALISLSIFLFFPVKYEAKATFKEMEEREESISIKDLLITSPGSRNFSEALGVMLSSRVLKPLVKELGLQASVICKWTGLNFFFTNPIENILSEFNEPLIDVDGFQFKDVIYEDESIFKAFLTFTSKDSFELLDREKKKLGSGIVGKPFSIENKILFTLIKRPKDLKLDYDYPFSLSPINPLLSFLKKNIKIKNHKEHKNIICLSFDSRDRNLAVKILNSLMDHYQNYLKEESKIFSKQQLAYLEERQDEHYKKLKKNLDEYTHYLSQGVDASGFMTIEEEVASLSQPQSKYLADLFSVELEVERLKNLNPEKKIFFSTDDSSAAREIRQMFFDLTLMEEQKDAINLSLQTKSRVLSGRENQNKNIDLELSHLKQDEGKIEAKFGEEIKTCLAKKQSEQEKKELLENLEESSLSDAYEALDLIRKERKGGEDLLKILSSGRQVEGDFAHHLEKIVRYSGLSLENFSKDEDKKKEICDCLKNHIHKLSLKEHMLKGKFYPSDDSEFNCIDTELAKKTYLNYCALLDETKLKIEELKHGKKELADDGFDVSSLSLILVDPVSAEVIKKAGKLSLEIKDINNYGEKSRLGLQKELEVQKFFLAHHIDEIIQLKEINKKLILEKIFLLKKALLCEINQKISLLNERLTNFVSCRVESLNSEKKLLQEKLNELHKKLYILPERWEREKLLQLKNEMSQAMIESASEILESKTISYHLHFIHSKPLDIAELPLLPKEPHLKFIFLLSYLVAIILAYCFFFMKSVFNGFYVSLSSLEIFGQKVGGFITPLCKRDPSCLDHKDLETLREIAHQIFEKKEVKIISLIGNGGPDYSFALASLIGKNERRVLVLNCQIMLSSKEKETRKFIKYLEKKVAIIKKEGYDLVSLGDSSLFMTEKFGSKSFRNLLDELSGEYDYILIYNDSSPTLSEAKIMLSFSHMVVVTVKNETMRELQHYIERPNDSYCRYLTFIAIS